MTTEERKKRIADLRDKFQSYDTLGHVDRLTAQKRGREFEKMVREVFRVWGLLKKDDYHTGDGRSEQIDGVIDLDGRCALLEVKWEKEKIAASELFAFLGKVEGKFLGTIGLFVSRNTLSSNFLNALRAGRRQCIVVIHGNDVDALFDPDFDLKDYLTSHLFHVCIDNLCHLSTEDYLKKFRRQRAKAEAEEPPAGGEADPVELKIKECLKDKAAGNLVDEFSKELSPANRITATRRILENYAALISDDGRGGSWRGDNLGGFLKELVKLLPEKWTSADNTFYMEKLSRDFKDPHYREMTEFFAPRYAHIPVADKEKFEERLKKQWDKVIDNWVDENEMSVATDALWEHLDSKTWSHLLVHFIGFLGSSRQTHRAQYTLARKVLRMGASKPSIRAAVRKLARKSAKGWFESDDYSDADGIKLVKKRVVSSLASVKPYLPDYDKVARAAVTKYAKGQAKGG